MGKAVAIIGPTATGKTNLAIKLCQKFGGEIISIDSRQAYRGMEIGTGKATIDPSISLRAGSGQLTIDKRETPIHFYDLVNPDEQLNAYDYSLKAWEKINDIWSRRKIPFLVGGSGFYLNVILGGVSLEAGAVDRDLRKELESSSVDQLIEKLSRIDPEKLKTIDVRNKYRLIRAVEVNLSSGQSEFFSASKTLKQVQGDIFIIGLTAANSYLYERADQRVGRMINGGLIGEVKGLVEKYGWGAPGLKTLGYREFKSYFEGMIQLNEAVQKLKFNTHAYIRRQKTYLKKYFANAHWFDISTKGFEKQVEKEVEYFLTR